MGPFYLKFNPKHNLTPRQVIAWKLFFYYIRYIHMIFSFIPKSINCCCSNSAPRVLEILVDSFLFQRLYLQLHRTLVEVREQLLCVTDKEIVFIRLEFLQHQSTDDQHVAPALDDQFISKTSVKRAKDETADEHVFHSPLRSTSFSLEVTYGTTKNEDRLQHMRRFHYYI